jgi:hypothetical protein
VMPLTVMLPTVLSQVLVLVLLGGVAASASACGACR